MFMALLQTVSFNFKPGSGRIVYRLSFLNCVLYVFRPNSTINIADKIQPSFYTYIDMFVFCKLLYYYQSAVVWNTLRVRW